jgi:hypothetical protein
MRCSAFLCALLLTYASPTLAADKPAKAKAKPPAVEEPVFVAGSAPSVRPPNAPSLTSVAKDARWYQKALTGVDAPYPASLKFLDDQGSWYTPFAMPGMTGRYDVRRWHR